MGVGGAKERGAGLAGKRSPGQGRGTASRDGERQRQIKSLILNTSVPGQGISNGNGLKERN